MRRVTLAKSVILALMLTLVFTLPVLADETPTTVVDTTNASQQITYLRSLKIVPPEGYEIILDGRVFNLIIELNIHKLKTEPEETFKSMVKETMFQEDTDTTLTLKARQFQDIATQVLLGQIDDDTAIKQLQTPDTMDNSIDGTFNGWTGATIFKLQNGQIWQQSSYDYIYHYAYNPKVTIYRYWSTYKMKVDGVDKLIDVVRMQ